MPGLNTDIAGQKVWRNTPASCRVWSSTVTLQLLALLLDLKECVIFRAHSKQNLLSGARESRWTVCDYIYYEYIHIFIYIYSLQILQILQYIERLVLAAVYLHLDDCEPSWGNAACVKKEWILQALHLYALELRLIMLMSSDSYIAKQQTWLKHRFWILVRHIKQARPSPEHGWFCLRTFNK